MNVTLVSIKLIIIGGLITLASLYFDDSSILIQSLESKTNQLTAVYNKISYFQKETEDIWMMNQSHHGLNEKKENWDRLAIIINKTTKPKTLKFLQLPPGELIWKPSLKAQSINYKVSCYACHSNGPRAIRPDYKALKVSLWNQLRITYWNLIIKSYGLLNENKKQFSEDLKLKTPFRHRANYDNEALTIDSCSKCHNGKTSWPNRAKLTRQNLIAIKFMTENKLMPPLAFKISDGDKKLLIKFLKGF